MESQDDAETAKGVQRQGWKQDPVGVRSNILEVALKEFADRGLSGARMDEIAAKTRTSKRMIYYYFGENDGLYHKVLEETYREVRTGEKELMLDHLEPEQALRRLMEFTFDHHSRHPDFIRIVMIENIHHGDYLKHSDLIRDLNQEAISRVETIYDKGVAQGVFREGLSPLSIHWMISALSFFNVSNRITFSLLFGNALHDKAGQSGLRSQVADTVLLFVTKTPE